MTQQEKDNLIQDYLNGASFDSLIKKYHHKFITIKNCLIENNIPIRSKSEAMKNKNSIIISPDIEQKIIINYNNGMGLASAGKQYNVSEYIVKKILNKYNIHIRSLKESVIIPNNNRKKYFCNENYFKTQNSDMAYILGFLAADGTVRKDSNQIKITLAQKDAELLEIIKEKLEYTGEVKYTTTSKGFNIATLEITSSNYKKDLALYNIVPQKTFSFSIPELLNKEYWIDFIRGYWDGDGSISTAGKSAIRSSVCSARKETLEQIVNFLAKEYNIPPVTIQSYNRKNTIYYIQYSNNSTRKLFKAMYYKKNIIYLKRKYDKFCQLCIDNKSHETVHPEIQDENVC